MSQLARTILKAALTPYAIGTKFNIQSGTTFKVYKGGGIDLWLALYEKPGLLFDVSNVGLLQVICRIKGSTGVWSILGSTNSVNPTLTDAQWQAGTGAHAVITLLGSATNVAAGNYDVTIKGFTTDDPADVDVFGISDLEVVEAGATATTVDLPGGATPATIEELNALTRGFLRAVMSPGQEITLPSPNGMHRRIIGMGDDGNPIDRFEEVA